jgi:transaldolase
MTKLTRLFTEHGQSPWLDNLSRAYLRDGTLARYIADGVRGVTANPAIFARAIEGSAAYDRQFSALIAAGRSIADAYWELVIDDIGGALSLLRPTYDESGGCDGFASIEVAPEIAHDPRPPWLPPARCTSGSPSRTCSLRSPPRPRACRPFKP